MTERKTLLVDLDNVVYPWAEVMAHLTAIGGLSNSYPQDLMAAYKTWSIWDDWQIPKGGFDRVWEKGIETGQMWGVNGDMAAFPLPRSVQALWTLSDREWHIHIITHRLNKFRLHDKAVLNTAEWLKWANIPYRSLTFTENKHVVLGDVLIDDNPQNLIEHPAPVKILYPAPHNRDFEVGDTGIKTLFEGEGLYPWDEIVEYLGDGARS